MMLYMYKPKASVWLVSGVQYPHVPEGCHGLMDMELILDVIAIIFSLYRASSSASNPSLHYIHTLLQYKRVASINKCASRIILAVASYNLP